MNGATMADLLRDALRRDAGRPFLTCYDDATGGRVELSYATFDNWVAKTANLLVDGLAAEPGERVALALPAHWQTAAWLFACWSAGLVAIPLGDRDTVPAADIVAADAARLPVAATSGAREVVGLSLHPLGAPLPEDAVQGLAGPVLDYATEVRGYGDRFAPYVPVDPDAPALVVDDRELTGAELAAAARAAAERWALTADDRVYATVSFATLDDLLAGLLAPLAAGASIVSGQGGDGPVPQERLAAERITAVLQRNAGDLGFQRLR